MATFSSETDSSGNEEHTRLLGTYLELTVEANIHRLAELYEAVAG